MKKKAKKKAHKPAKSNKSKPKPVIRKSGIAPLGDRVLIKPFTEDEAKGDKGNKHFGIILPDADSKEKSSQGKVIAVGHGRFEDGKLVPVGVRPGDIVIFSKYGYDEVEYMGEDLYLLKEDNILAVIN